MKPVSPVLPGICIDLAETVFGAGQPEYTPLPAVRLDGPEGEIVTRWELDDADRARLLAGGSVYLHVFTFGQRLQPVAITTERPTLEVLLPHGIRTIGGEQS